MEFNSYLEVHEPCKDSIVLFERYALPIMN